jgi:protein-disulfide isomerase
MPSLKIPVGSQDHAQGSPDAAVTLVEYGDYQCPYCGEAYPIVKRLQELLGNHLRFVFRNFPIAELHPNAISAAVTAEFAAAHDRFWPVHDGIYENQERLGLPLYEELMQAQGLSPGELRTAIESGAYEERIRNDFQGGVRSGVNGTPSFFINGQRYDGPADLRAMADALGEAIAAAGSIRRT